MKDPVSHLFDNPLKPFGRLKGVDSVLIEEVTVMEASCVVSLESGQRNDLVFRSIEASDYSIICSWIKSRKSMELVCSDKGSYLTTSILNKWILDSIVSIVLCKKDCDNPIGFCTLSKQEIRFSPYDHVELCHLVVDPRKNYLATGSALCSVSRQVAKDLGFKHVFGRVVPWNRFGIYLAKHQCGVEITEVEEWLVPGFRWYRLPEVKGNEKTQA